MCVVLDLSGKPSFFRAKSSDFHLLVNVPVGFL